MEVSKKRDKYLCQMYKVFTTYCLDKVLPILFASWFFPSLPGMTEGKNGKNGKHLQLN